MRETSRAVFPDPSGVVGRLNTQALSLINRLKNGPNKWVREITRSALVDLVMPRRDIRSRQVAAAVGSV